MAFVKDVVASPRSIRTQPTQVICGYAVSDVAPGKRMLQIDTAGSDQRENPGKVSQTLQFDEARARQLWELLGREFGFR